MPPVPECLIDQFEPDSGRSFRQAREVPHTHVAACDDSPMTIEGDAAKLLALMDSLGLGATRACAELFP
jgi:hypothetical protein